MSADDLLFRLRVQLENTPSHGSHVACITAWDANHEDYRTGHRRIDVALTLRWTEDGKRMRREVWKRGETWCAVARGNTVDGRAARELVMSLFAMRPGDTDADYFAGWTEEQLAFAETWGEQLGCEREARYCDPETGAVRV